MEEHRRTHHDQLIQPAMEMNDKCVNPTLHGAALTAGSQRGSWTRVRSR